MQYLVTKPAKVTSPAAFEIHLGEVLMLLVTRLNEALKKKEIKFKDCSGVTFKEQIRIRSQREYSIFEC